MRVLRKGCIVLLSIIMFIVGTIGVSAENLSTVAYLERNSESTDGYTKLVESFGVSGITTIPEYPEAYGGAYIDDEGYLVVQTVMKESISTTEMEVFSQQALCEITGVKSLRTEQVKYTFNQLIEANNAIAEHITQNDGDSTGTQLETQKECLNFQGEIVQTSINPSRNAVEVWLDDISKESIENFCMDVYDAPYIVFKLAPEGQPILEATIHLSGGGYTSNYGSIGFPATYNGEKGFVTAAHCTVSGTNYINDKVYGTRVSVNSTYDYAFIKQTNASITINRVLYGTTKQLQTGIYAYLAYGSAVGRTGFASGYDTGKVNGLAVYNKVGNDMMQTDCTSLQGDSGGPYFGSPTSANPKIAGIHLGGWNGTAPITYFRGIGYLVNAGYVI